MTSTLATKIGVFATLVLIFVAILADQALQRKAVSRNENEGAKRETTGTKKETPVAEPKEDQSQVSVDWKKRFERYRYQNKGEEEKPPEWKWWEEENKPVPPDSGE
jgi:hypothetical protein